MNTIDKQADGLHEPLDLVWGAEEIAQVIRRTRRQVFHMLQRNQIKGAQKVGGCWVSSRAALEKQFCGPAD